LYNKIFYKSFGIFNLIIYDKHAVVTVCTKSFIGLIFVMGMHTVSKSPPPNVVGDSLLISAATGRLLSRLVLPLLYSTTADLESLGAV
jgi:nitrate/nitrite transporter NarK